MPLEIRGAHILIRSAQLVRKTRLEYALPFLKNPAPISSFRARDSKSRKPLAPFLQLAHRVRRRSRLCLVVGESFDPDGVLLRVVAGGARQRENVYFCTRETFQHCAIGGGDISTKVKTVFLSVGYTKLRTAVRRRNHC